MTPDILVLSGALGLPLRVLARQAVGPAVQEYRIQDAWGRDVVEFRTSAPLEEIVGTTNRVTGVLRADPGRLRSSSTSARVEADLTAIQTGIDLRNEHTAKALGAERQPKAVFTLGRVLTASDDSLQPNRPVEITAEGTLELNGVRATVPVRATVTYVPKGGPFSQVRPGNFVKLVATFDVSLDEFHVERKGSVLPLQVGPTAHVTVTALASDATGAELEKYRASAKQYLGRIVN
jgi:polyisoprenoid-binding protein YceI